MQKFLIALIVLLITPASVFAFTDSEGYDEHTIRPSDLPQDAPRFEMYKSRLFHGRNAKPLITGDARNFRTRISAWSKEEPNFAGHFIMATWGCGTNCTQFTIIDASTGKVFEPKGITTNVAVNVHDDLLQGGDFWHSSAAIKFKRDSRLLILIGTPEEDVSRRGISYYVWTGTELRLIRFVKKI